MQGTKSKTQHAKKKQHETNGKTQQATIKRQCPKDKLKTQETIHETMRHETNTQSQDTRDKKQDTMSKNKKQNKQ